MALEKDVPKTQGGVELSRPCVECKKPVLRIYPRGTEWSTINHDLMSDDYRCPNCPPPHYDYWE